MDLDVLINKASEIKKLKKIEEILHTGSFHVLVKSEGKKDPVTGNMVRPLNPMVDLSTTDLMPKFYKMVKEYRHSLEENLVQEILDGRNKEDEVYSKGND